MTDKEKAFIEKKRAELRSVRAKCAQYCPFYDHVDHDCDRYGRNHPSPSRCVIFLQDCLEDWRKEETQDAGK